jgi:solute:Na+ symporter, SSS family
MQMLDWIVVGLFFVVMIGIGAYSFKTINNSSDFFVGGGKVPWWLSGVSHHVSGHSGVVFVAYAAICYNFGFTMYVWWALTITIGISVGAIFVAPRWPRLRQKLNIESPTEYMKLRYGLSSQQLTVWVGVLVKLLDIGAKWASMGIILGGFTGLPIWMGIILSGLVSLIYVTIGGLWADLLTDFVQFLVQLIAGLVLLFAVLAELGGFGAIFTIWDKLPPANSKLFNGTYTPLWVFLYMFVVFLSYNGGTWNLAARFISTPDGKDAKKSAILSAVLYLVWPLIIFFPMWASPILFPGMKNPAQELYPALTMKYLPTGLVGLVLASMFASTMGMTVSDINTLSAVAQRDMLPVLFKKFKEFSKGDKRSLVIARTITLILTALTIIVALNQSKFGGVIGLIISWFAALVGPTAIPMILGLFPQFKHCDNRVAIISILGGVAGFVVTKYTKLIIPDLVTAFPLLVTLVIYVSGEIINRRMGKKVPDEVEDLVEYLSNSDSYQTTAQVKAD